jgi:hypothetical protein
VRFNEHAEAGRKLSAKQVDGQIRQLGRDPRFGAVVAWLQRNEEAWSAATSQQEMAANHGKLAHAGGSLYAVRLLQAQLITLLDRPEKSQDSGPFER